jgi:hypothetical protein
MAVPTLPLYLFVGISGIVSFIAMIIAFHLFSLKSESLLLSFVGMHSVVTALSVPIIDIVKEGYMADEIAYGLNIALGVLLFAGMIGGAKILENDVESILLGYISTLAIAVAGATFLVSIVSGVV